MQTFTSFVSICVVVLGISCCSSKSNEQAKSPVSDTGRVSRPAMKIPRPTALRANASIIVAVVDSVAGGEGDNYRLSIYISKADPFKGMDSFAGAGQHLTVSPDYILDDSGAVEKMDERNRKLISLKAAQPGDVFGGTISMNASGAWVLVEVFDR